MTGLFACNLTVSQQIKLLKSQRHQCHQHFTMKFHKDKNELQKPQKWFCITLVTCKKLIICTTTTRKWWTSPEPSLKCSRTSPRRTFQTLSFWIGPLFIQLQVDNSMIMVLWPLMDAQVLMKLLMLSKSEGVCFTFLTDLSKATWSCTRERQWVSKLMLLEESNFKLITLELISSSQHAGKSLVHMFGNMVPRRPLNRHI